MVRDTRGVKADDSAPPLVCHRCGGALGPLRWKPFANGTLHIHAVCTACGRGRYVQQTPEAIAAAQPTGPVPASPSLPFEESAEVPIEAPAEGPTDEKRARLNEILGVIFALGRQVADLESRVRQLLGEGR